MQDTLIYEIIYSVDNELEAIARKIDALNLWRSVAHCNWAVKVYGVALPYFCTILPNDGNSSKATLMMLEGWKTFYDYLRTRNDNSFGFYSIPSEFNQFALIPSDGGAVRIAKSETGFVPRALNELERKICAKILWQSYGVMMRIEADKQFSIDLVGNNSIFARVEDKSGEWHDEHLELIPAGRHVESIAIRKENIQTAKALPFEKDEIYAVDLRILPNIYSSEKFPRLAYALALVDTKTSERLAFEIASVSHYTGLKELWELSADRVLTYLAQIGKVPGEIQVCSQRMFRMLRPLCTDFPFKLSIYDKVDALDKVFKEVLKTDINQFTRNKGATTHGTPSR